LPTKVTCRPVEHAVSAGPADPFIAGARDWPVSEFSYASATRFRGTSRGCRFLPFLLSRSEPLPHPSPPFVPGLLFLFLLSPRFSAQAYLIGPVPSVIRCCPAFVPSYSHPVQFNDSASALTLPRIDCSSHASRASPRSLSLSLYTSRDRCRLSPAIRAYWQLSVSSREDEPIWGSRARLEAGRGWCRQSPTVSKYRQC